MYQSDNDNDKEIEEKFSAILAESMEPGKRRLLSEMFELNRQVRTIKKKIRGTTCPEELEELRQEKIELQTKILDYMDSIEDYKNLI